MKKFKFRLQSVLDARDKALVDLQLELSQLQHKLYQQEQQLESLVKSRLNYCEELETYLNQGKSIDFLTIKNYRDYIDKLADDILNQQEIIKTTIKKVEEKKQEVLEAHKNKEILVKLKEKDKGKFESDFEKQQSIEIDEIALSRFGKTY